MIIEDTAVHLSFQLILSTLAAELGSAEVTLFGVKRLELYVINMLNDYIILYLLPTVVAVLPEAA